MTAWPFTTGDLVAAADLNSIGMVKVDEIALDSVTEFTGIEQTWRDLYLSVVARSTTVATTATLSLRVNSSATAAYYAQARRLTNATESPITFTAQTEARVGRITAASATAEFFGHVGIWLPQYASTSTRIVGRSVASAMPSTTSTDWSLDEYGFMYNSSSAVTAVSLSVSTGFAAGSVATLYGVGQA